MKCLLRRRAQHGGMRLAGLEHRGKHTERGVHKLIRAASCQLRQVYCTKNILFRIKDWPQATAGQ